MKELKPKYKDYTQWSMSTFLEHKDIDLFKRDTEQMKNMLNLKSFAGQVKHRFQLEDLKMLSAGGGIGIELLLINPAEGTLLELNPNLLEKFKKYCLDRKIDCKFIQYNLNKLPLPFEDKEFDLVSANSVIEHIPNILELVKEFQRISRAMFIGSIPIGMPPEDQLHTWMWDGYRDVQGFAQKFGGIVMGSYWNHYDILWTEY